jgi:propionyl-CoA synthetase
MKYAEIYKESIEQPESFWGKAGEAIHWTRKWDKVLDDSGKPFYRWFAGGELNTCYNALDYHVENGRKDQVAIIYDSPVTDTVRKISYGQLLESVSVFAGALSGIGVKKGDTVIIYMPMIPEALTAVLACARIGAVHSVVFGGFAPNELAIRIDDAKPKVIVSASCGVEGKKTLAYKPLLDEAIKIASHKPQNCIIYQRPQVKADLTPGRDIDWDNFVKGAKPVPGYNVQILDADGNRLPNGEEGSVVIKLPLPPGCLPTLWQDDKRYLEYVTERPGYYVTGDGGRFGTAGYLFIMGRLDAVINVAGHRLSTGAMEEIVSRHKDVAECAVLGAEDQLKGQVPVGFVVLKAGVDRKPEEIIKELVQMVRNELGALACFKEAAVVRALPKTRSGKTLRGTMRKIVDGKDYVVPSTIDDPAVLSAITESARTIGYGKK